MKLIVSIMVMVAIFPIINLSCSALDITNITSGLITVMYTIESVLITGVTSFSDIFIKSKLKKGIQIGIILVVSGILGLIYSLIIKEVSIVFWIVSCGVLGIVSRKLFYTDNRYFSNAYVFIVVSLIYVICAFMGWQSGLRYSKLINGILYIIFCIGFALFVNRSNLERVIYRRTQNLDSIPKNIFKYNSKLTVIVCLIPIPILILSNRIGNALYNILMATISGVITIGRFLSNLFAKDNTPIENVESDSPIYKIYYEDNSNMFWDIFTIITIGLILFLIYYYHEDIIKKCKEILLNIKYSLNKSIMAESIEVKEIPYSEGYTDYIKNIPNRYTKKSFKKDYRLYLTMDTSTDTLKFGYSTLVNGLNLLGYNISPYDTITDISNKFDCVEFSKIYLSIRYNNVIPTNENRLLLDSLLKDISKKL